MTVTMVTHGCVNNNKAGMALSMDNRISQKENRHGAKQFVNKFSLNKN